MALKPDVMFQNSCRVLEARKQGCAEGQVAWQMIISAQLSSHSRLASARPCWRCRLCLVSGLQALVTVAELLPL